MKYKQLSEKLVIRSSDGVKVSVDDPDYVAWLKEGNSPFPPYPPVGKELDNILSED
jgi:hypothetical protein